LSQPYGIAAFYPDIYTSTAPGLGAGLIIIRTIFVSAALGLALLTATARALRVRRPDPGRSAMFKTASTFVTLILLVGSGGAGDQDNRCAEAGVAALAVR
jgi:hypothetical protein